jgi:multiple antibiotic resistance protein
MIRKLDRTTHNQPDAGAPNAPAWAEYVAIGRWMAMISGSGLSNRDEIAPSSPCEGQQHVRQACHAPSEPVASAQPRATWGMSVVVALLFGAGLMLFPEAALARTDVTELRQLSSAEIFAMLFLMLGPFKIIGPFLKITQTSDTAIVRRTALQATAFAGTALFLAAVLGDHFLDKYDIPLPVLALSGGIILFVVALQKILQQPEPTDETTTAAPPAASMRAAMMPLAFPTIATPYGIAALIVFVSMAPDVQAVAQIGGIVLVIMLLNLIVMLTARSYQVITSVVLPVLGAILGVIQVALGLKVIVISLRALGIF